MDGDQRNGKASSRQYIWIVRYGLTYPPLEEGVGPYDSDIDPDVGLQHAEAIADRIASTVGTEQFPTTVLSSPFRRCAHTAHILATKLSQVSPSTKVQVCIEEGLTEWLTPSLVVNKNTNVRTFPKTPKQLVDEYGYTTICQSYSSVNPSIRPEDVKEYLEMSIPGEKSPQYPENEDQLLLRMRTTLKQIILLLGSKQMSNNIVIVAHAPCIQALVFNAMKIIEHDDDAARAYMKPWPLGGITLFSRDASGEDTEGDGWKLEFYGSTSHMPGEYKQGLKAWSLPCFSE